MRKRVVIIAATGVAAMIGGVLAGKIKHRRDVRALWREVTDVLEEAPRQDTATPR